MVRKIYWLSGLGWSGEQRAERGLCKRKSKRPKRHPRTTGFWGCEVSFESPPRGLQSWSKKSIGSRVCAGQESKECNRVFTKGKLISPKRTLGPRRFGGVRCRSKAHLEGYNRGQKNLLARKLLPCVCSKNCIFINLQKHKIAPTPFKIYSFEMC